MQPAHANARPTRQRTRDGGRAKGLRGDRKRPARRSERAVWARCVGILGGVLAAWLTALPMDPASGGSAMGCARAWRVRADPSHRHQLAFALQPLSIS